MSNLNGPLVLCGKMPEVARGMIANVSPDYEVIHVIFSLEQAIKELPSILSGKGLPDSSAEADSDKPLLGTQKYDRLPLAIVAGGGYDEEAFRTMRDACKDVNTVPWLQHDLTITGERPLGGPGYSEYVAQRLKDKLSQIGEEGKFGQDGWYKY